MFILVFIITILILVVIHELGHFLVAKRFDIKVLEFGFGLPPRIKGKKWGETLVSLNWLPFGGFVRLLGEDEIDPKAKEYQRSFAAQTVLKRSLVVVAGVLMNLFLALVLYYIVLAQQNFTVQIPKLVDHQFIGLNQSQEKALFISQLSHDFSNQKVDAKVGERIVAVNGQAVGDIDQLRALLQRNKEETVKLTLSNSQRRDQRTIEVMALSAPAVFVDSVNEDSPARIAQIKAGERVLAIDDQNVKGLKELAMKIKEKAGREVKLTLSDAQGVNLRQVSVTPRLNPPSGQGALGVVLRESMLPNMDFSELTFYRLSYDSPGQKVLAGPIHAVNLVSYSFQILGQTISQAVSKKDLTPVSHSVAGPVGITNLLREILQIKNPLIPYLDFMAAISLNLALVNILPFPGLDGGRFFFLLVEGTTRKKLNQTVERYLHTAGLVILLGLIFLITISDIRKIIF